MCKVSHWYLMVRRFQVLPTYRFVSPKMLVCCTEENMRQRGTGGLIKVKRKDGSPASPYWYLVYWQNGRQVRESSKTTSKMQAEALLRKRLSERDAGNKPAVDIAKITYAEIRDALVQEYEINKRK